jgi:two-component system sensor histidine kinase GlrK
MKISTRIVSGFGILIVLIALLVVYQIFALHRMQSRISELSQVNFRVAVTALQLMRDRDLVEEYAKKSLLLSESAYDEQLKAFSEDFEKLLQDLKSSARSKKVRAEVERLDGFWSAFTAALHRYEQAQAAGLLQEFPVELDRNLEQLRAQSYTVYEACVDTINSQVRNSEETARRAELIAAVAAAIALVVSSLVSLFIVRSITLPLRQLTAGTRAIAEGKYFYRLDASRSDEFSQVARDFNIMTHRLNDLDELKRAFVSHVSHELKAPLASMRETTQLLLEELPGPLNEKQKRLLDLNLQSGRRLTSIVGNLLDLSKMEAGVMEYDLKMQDLVPLVRAAAAEYGSQALEKKIQLEVSAPEQPVYVECDADRMIQVIGNLIGNALKFSPKSETVRVAVKPVAGFPERMPQAWQEYVAETGAGTAFALLSVSDNGPGIPEYHKPRIFEKFHQVSVGKKLPGQGVGLGLAISRTIMEAHRGAIWVEDNPGGGSVFYLLLADADAAALGKAPA